VTGRGAQDSAARARRRQLLRAHPAWSTATLARAVGRSATWLKRWRARPRAAPPDDEPVRAGRSRARPRPPPSTSPAVSDRLLAIRDHPPGDRQRVPRPRAVLDSLERDAARQARGVRLPRSTRTLWAMLTRQGRLAHRLPRPHAPSDRPPPLTAGQRDCKDGATVPAAAEGKQQHVVEARNGGAVGPSLLLAAGGRPACTEEPALAAVAERLGTHGLPETLPSDRDPRVVGGPTGRACPSPFARCLTCLGVGGAVCPPRRPERNGFVGRDHRTDDRECLKLQRPTTPAAAAAVTAAFLPHDNEERPHQARSWGNQPPRAAFPAPPARPAVPAAVDPDRWLQTDDGRHDVRTVRGNATVTLERGPSDVSRALVGHYGVLAIDAATRTLAVRHRQQVVKPLPRHGRPQATLPLDD
jgi:hypothetical protein